MLLENKDKFKKKLKEKTGLGIYVPNIRQLIWNSEFLMERFNGWKKYLIILSNYTRFNENATYISVIIMYKLFNSAFEGLSKSISTVKVALSISLLGPYL